MKKVYYVGIDQHKKTSTLNIRGGDGRMIRTVGIRHDRLKALRDVISTLDGKVQTAVEATGFYWWMVQELRRLGAEAHLAHPAALKMIFKAKNKTDKNDAERISKLLWLGQLPESYIPTEEQIQARELLGTRRLLVKVRGQIGNRIHQLFAKLNEPVPTRGLLYSPKNIKILRTVNLPGEWGQSLEQLIQSLEDVQREICRCEERIQELVGKDEFYTWLDQVYGFGSVAAATVGARVGTFDRFANRRVVGSYFGLTPRVDNSADKCRSGHIDKMGPTEIRKILVQAVHCMIQKRPEAQAYFSYLSRRARASKVYVAMARRLIVGLRAARVKQEPFDLARCFKVPQTRTFQGRGGPVTLVRSTRNIMER